MAIIFPDNLYAGVGNPLDAKYLSVLNQPYTNVAAVNTRIVLSQRSVGLTVRVGNDEYWYATGVTDTDLVRKSFGWSNLANGSTVAGCGTIASGASLSFNTIYGVNAGKSITSGKGNVAIGADALCRNVSGNNNIAIGVNALVTNTTGIDNIAIGSCALQTNVAGIFNIAIGGCALIQNIASHNTAIGKFSMYTNNSGSANVGLGNFSLFTNTSGKNNIAVGMEALRLNQTGDCNVAIGYENLYSNTIGKNNTSVGHLALFANTIGSGNTTQGHRSLICNTTGCYNTAFGDSVLSGNTIGKNNTGIGYEALRLNRTGCTNVAIGCGAGFSEMGSNKLYISNSRTVNPLIYGDFSTSCVKINGQLKITGVTNGAVGDYMLVWNSGDTKVKKVPYISGGTGGGSVIEKIYQPMHGFIVGDVVGFSGSLYSKAIADGTYGGEVIGMVNDVINIDNFYLTQSGYLTGLTITLSAGTTYFLSDSVAGQITDTAPIINGYMVKAVFLATSTNAGWVLPYPGYFIDSGTTPSWLTLADKPAFIGSGNTTVTPSGNSYIFYSSGGSGESTFSSNLVVSIAAGKTFGKYENGDTILASGKTAAQVIQMAILEALPPTVNLSASPTNIAFGESAKTVTVNFSYTIAYGASVASVLLEWRRGGVGAWSALTTSTGATSFPQVIDDSSNRFNTAVINYRYTVTDTASATASATYNVTPTAYAVPAMSISLGGTAPSPQTQNSREKGNVTSNPSGSIGPVNALVKITAWTLQRRYNGGSYIILASGSSLSVTNVAIPATLDNTIPIGATSIDYRITYVDEYTSGAGGTQSIAFYYYSYYGYDPNTTLTESEIELLENKAKLSSQNLTWNPVTVPVGEYAYYAIPQAVGYSNVTQILRTTPAPPETTAWTNLSSVSVTNTYGESLNYWIWKTNATQAYTGVGLIFS